MKRKIISTVISLSLLITGMGIIAAVAQADTVFKGKITVGGKGIDCIYKITGSDTVQIGEGVYEGTAIDTSAAGALTIPDTVMYNGKNYTVTSIGINAFESCQYLTDTGLATNNTVTSLQENSFYQCTSIKETGLAINHSVKTVGFSAFSECNTLTTTGLATNNTVTELVRTSFCYCNSLTDTGLATNSTLLKIGDGAFEGCSALKHADIGPGVTTIEARAFSFCRTLTDVNFYGNYPTIDKDWLGDSVPSGLTIRYIVGNKTWTGKGSTDVARSGDSLIAMMGTSVTFNSQGGSGVDTRYLATGTRIDKPQDPVRSGYTFDGGYMDVALLNPWNFSVYTVDGDTNLYAKWIKDPEHEASSESGQTPSSASTVAPAKAKLASVKSAKDGTKYKKITIRWKADSKASGYQIYISKSNNFKKLTVSSVIKKNTTASKVFKKLNKKQRYYVKVRAFKAVGGSKTYGAWSSAKRTP